jgi:hypothetical protein
VASMIMALSRMGGPPSSAAGRRVAGPQGFPGEMTQAPRPAPFAGAANVPGAQVMAILSLGRPRTRSPDMTTAIEQLNLFGELDLSAHPGDSLAAGVPPGLPRAGRALAAQDAAAAPRRISARQATVPATATTF